MNLEQINTSGTGTHLGVFLETPLVNYINRRRISEWAAQRVRTADGSTVVNPTPRGIQIEWRLDQPERVEQARADLDGVLHGGVLEVASLPEVGVDLESLLTTLALESRAADAQSVDFASAYGHAVIGTGGDSDEDLLRSVTELFSPTGITAVHGSDGAADGRGSDTVHPPEAAAAVRKWVNVPGHSGTILRVASPLDPPRDRHHALARSMSNALLGGTPDSVIVKHFAEDLRVSYSPFSRLAESEGVQWWLMDLDTGPGFEQELLSAAHDFLVRDAGQHQLAGRMRSVARIMLRGTDSVLSDPAAAVQSTLARVNGFDPWGIGDATREELGRVDGEDIGREIECLLDSRRQRTIVVSQFGEPKWFSG